MIGMTRPAWLRGESQHLATRQALQVAPEAPIVAGMVLGARGDGLLVPLDPTAGTDPAVLAFGAQRAVGIALAEPRMVGVARFCEVLIRGAIVAGDQLLWPAGITMPQRTIAIATLAGRGIVVHTREPA